MENTLGNKAKFFAQYWGQIVLSDGIELGGNVGDCSEELFLQLKPLSSISDEDAIEVANIIGWHEHRESQKIISGHDFINGEDDTFNLSACCHLKKL